MECRNNVPHTRVAFEVLLRIFEAVVGFVSRNVPRALIENLTIQLVVNSANDILRVTELMHKFITVGVLYHFLYCHLCGRSSSKSFVCVFSKERTLQGN